jgi:hypothetical protein
MSEATKKAQDQAKAPKCPAPALLEGLATEIRELKKLAAKTPDLLADMGERLATARRELKSRRCWVEWLGTQVGFSPASAYRYMKLAEWRHTDPSGFQAEAQRGVETGRGARTKVSQREKLRNPQGPRPECPPVRGETREAFAAAFLARMEALVSQTGQIQGLPGRMPAALKARAMVQVKELWKAVLRWPAFVNPKELPLPEAVSAEDVLPPASGEPRS